MWFGWFDYDRQFCKNVNKMNLINFLYVTPLHSIAGMVEKEIKMWVGAFH